MGYTHYFPGLKATPGVITDAGKVIDASSVTICGPKGQGLPVLNAAEGIRLNGFGAAGEAHETFRLQGSVEPRHADMWTFCTTAGKPYDAVVTAILIAAAVHALGSPTGTVRSDGRWGNWAAGVSLYEEAVRPLTEDERIALELNVEAMRPSGAEGSAGR
ncbi:hypothetical protein BMF89_00060 [Arthrobacter sp. SRS-W-1-2016]|uniref:hypothetical protein n=1 Tax=Arthrobacter sp. SRS-W-1-2016 TaxID=1930254 RepID=UPI000990A60E|nr:hypothetical protein [Arthrobacter sp. SRS-W-1-2016]OOP65280.1 hypothetical protein BMF89_00060 [Arthrobacter sp. SRS-W-1-2016]